MSDMESRGAGSDVPASAVAIVEVFHSKQCMVTTQDTAKTVHDIYRIIYDAIQPCAQRAVYQHAQFPRSSHSKFCSNIRTFPTTAKTAVGFSKPMHVHSVLNRRGYIGHVTNRCQMDYLIELEESDEDLGEFLSISCKLGLNHYILGRYEAQGSREAGVHF